MLQELKSIITINYTVRVHR